LLRYSDSAESRPALQGIAKVLFVVFLIGAVASFLMHGRSRV
jgi:uncharacterized membrane protein YtjA (UPF0391 family)